MMNSTWLCMSYGSVGTSLGTEITGMFQDYSFSTSRQSAPSWTENTGTRSNIIKDLSRLLFSEAKSTEHCLMYLNAVTFEKKTYKISNFCLNIKNIFK